MNDLEIINIDNENIEKHGCYCLMNRKKLGYSKKIEWIKKRVNDGLRIKMLYSKKEGYIGFIEYVPGNLSWRGFSNSDYMFIHCIYIAKKKNRQLGYGKILIDECIKESKDENKKGVATITSGGSMLAEKDIFIQNGFKISDTAPPKYCLMVKQFVNEELPKFNKNREETLKKYDGLTLIYANQCPYFYQSVKVIEKVSKEYGVDLTILELDTVKDVQHVPSLYGVFTIIYKGKLLAEHYVSEKRFRNILDKELKLRKE